MAKKSILRKGDRAVYKRGNTRVIVIIDEKKTTGYGQTYYNGHTYDGIPYNVLWSWHLRKCPKRKVKK